MTGRGTADDGSVATIEGAGRQPADSFDGPFWPDRPTGPPPGDILANSRDRIANNIVQAIGFSVMPQTKISVVVPVRDRESEIVGRVERILDGLVDLTTELSEVVVVDDGSQDATAEILSELDVRYPTVRIARHERPRGMEAAGQTGLERSIGELVFIQETDSELRLEDLRRLLEMSKDESVVAARAESREEPIAPSLLRRLKLWGTDASERVRLRGDAGRKRSLQMVRRPHLQRLAAAERSAGNAVVPTPKFVLEGNTERVNTVQRSSTQR